MLIIFLTLILAGILFVLSPRLAVIALAACVSLWLEWKFTGLFGIRLGLVDIAVVGGLIGLFFSRIHETTRIPSKGLIITYMILSILAVVFSPVEMFESAGKLIWVPYKEIYVTLSFFLFYAVISHEKLLFKTVILILISACFSALIGIIQAILRYPFYLDIGTYGERMSSIASDIYNDMTLRVFGTLWHPNSFGTFLVWPLSISISLLIIDRQYKYKKILPFLIFIQGIALILTQSRGAWMGFMISLVIIALHTGIYKKASFLAFILAGIIAIGAIHIMIPDADLIPGDITKRFFSSKDVKEDPAMAPRYKRWEYFYKMSLERPLTGFGVIATKEVTEHFQDYAASPHNTYLSIAVKRGYIALAILIVILFKCARLSKKIFKSSQDNFIKALSLGIFSGLIGLFCVSAFFDSFLEEKQLNILFWLLLAITLRAQAFMGYDSKDNLTTQNS